MPWSIRKQDGKYCVIKDDDGENEGCHDSRADAVKQQRALYANESAEPETLAEEVKDAPAQWEGVLAFEGKVTSDGRYLIPGEISERELPLTLMVQTVNGEGHSGAQVGGKIIEIWREQADDGSIAIMGNGPVDDSEFGRESARMLEDEVLRGVSLDLAITESIPLDRETLEPLEIDDMDIEAMLNGDFVTGLKGKIMGATLCPFPAFEDAALKIVPVGGERAIVASAGWMKVHHVHPDGGFTITAAAAIKPPSAWFDNPMLTEPTPLTFTPEGRVYGHLGAGCHVSYAGECVPPPRSPTDYAYFHTARMPTAEGTLVPVGKIMYSREAGKHAPDNYTAQQASRHYDDSTKEAAFVRAGDDAHGIWVAGVLKPGLGEDVLEHLHLHPPSGDWRPINGVRELIAAFCVPVPGFPIPIPLAASAETEEDSTLILGPMVIDEEVARVEFTSAQRRRKAVLRQRLTA